MGDSDRVTVIGGGISGLACAYRLKELGLPVTLLEANDRVGGLVGTIRVDGFLFESGPQSFLGAEEILNLITKLGIAGELQEADPHAPRFILRHGHLQKVPMSPPGLLTSPLLGAKSRWKIVSEPFRQTTPPDGEETIADFVRRKFGHEILEYLVAPFVSGVYAGDPEKLSLRAAFPSLEEWEREHGSVLRGAIKSRPAKGKRKGPAPLCSFQSGVELLIRALSEHLGECIQTRTKVVSIRRSRQDDKESHELRIARDGREETLSAETIILATPAYAASHLVDSISATLAHALSGIAYAPVAVVAAGYYEKQVRKSIEGFGFLAPRSERIRTLGTVWSSSLFSGRAPEAMAQLTSFVGGATDPGIVGKSEKEIESIVLKENARILDIEGLPTVTRVWKHPKALPQYNLGHGHIIELIRDAEREIPGMFFAGNYLEGPSLGKCVEQAFKTADAVRNYLDSPS
jgi:oxygen-dependent protoporphyrinogen oxidase